MSCSNLLATGFLAIWGSCSFVTRLFRGPRANELRLPPTRSQLATFFAIVTIPDRWICLAVGGVEYCARSATQPGHFYSATVRSPLNCPSSDVEVVFNAQKIEVPADGVVSLPIDQPGSYVYEVEYADGLVGGGKFRVNAGALVKEGVLRNARRVVVAGPVRTTVYEDVEFSCRAVNGQTCIYSR